MGAQHCVAHRVREALESLDKDRDYLKKGGVMNDDMIDATIAARAWKKTCATK